MHRLIITIAMLILIIMHINLSESKPFMLDNTWPDKVRSPINPAASTDMSSSSSSDEQDTINIERRRRNCFAYAKKLQNRARKWMCW